jgi:hypothetical protein
MFSSKYTLTPTDGLEWSASRVMSCSTRHSALVGEHSAIDLMSSVEAQITLSHYGEAVRVSVPPRSQVMTPDEFAAARG